jgi:hypothetical protein
MKRLPPAAVGLLLTVAVALLIFAWREVGALQEEMTSLKKEREGRSPPPDGLTDRPRKISGVLHKRKSANEDEDDEDSRNRMELLKGAGKEQIERRSSTRLALLKQRLHLRPDQMAILENHAAEHNARLAATFERLKNKTAQPPDMGLFIDWISGRFDLPVKDLLDPEQAKLFTGFDAEDRSNRIETLVNMEITELQNESAIPMSREQKDKAYAALTRILTAEDDLGDAYFTDDGQFNARVDASLIRRSEALRGILDATQMEDYVRVLEEQRVSVTDWFPSHTGPQEKDRTANPVY